MKKILLFATPNTSTFLLCSCDTDNNNTNNPDYQRGYDVGVEDGKHQICNECNDNAINDNQEELCLTICG